MKVFVMKNNQNDQFQFRTKGIESLRALKKRICRRKNRFLFASIQRQIVMQIGDDENYDELEIYGCFASSVQLLFGTFKLLLVIIKDHNFFAGYRSSGCCALSALISNKFLKMGDISYQ